MILTIQTAVPVLNKIDNGMGYELRMPYGGHHAHLQIGNVSIAFDARNVFDRPADESYDGFCFEFGTYWDDPVRLNNVSCNGDDIGETVMRALAADLGFTVSK